MRKEGKNRKAQSKTKVPKKMMEKFVLLILKKKIYIIYCMCKENDKRE